MDIGNSWHGVNTTLHDTPKHLRNVLSILKPLPARGTAITSPQLRPVIPGEREHRNQDEKSSVCDQCPASPVHSRCQIAEVPKCMAKIEKSGTTRRYTSSAVKHHWFRATRLVLDWHYQFGW